MEKQKKSSLDEIFSKSPHLSWLTHWGPLKYFRLKTYGSKVISEIIIWRSGVEGTGKSIEIRHWRSA
jgi:hypothetical protein